jgi:hypothetical protein
VIVWAAKALGLIVPAALLVAADEVMERQVRDVGFGQGGPTNQAMVFNLPWLWKAGVRCERGRIKARLP